MIKHRLGGAVINTLLVFLIITGLISWVYFQLRNNEQESNQVQPTPSPTLDQTSGWKSLSNSNYSLKYPNEAKGEVRENESVVSFMGQKQIDSGRTQTELFDGYSFRVGEIVNDSKLSLEELSKNERENAQSNCLNMDSGQVSQLEKVSINGQVGYQYSAVGCYTDYTETIISFKDKMYRISQLYVGNEADQRNYKETTNRILSTLKFVN